MFKSIGTTELIIIAVVVLLLFGGKRIPEFFRGMLESIREFKTASKDDDSSSSNKK